ncbi:MAG: tRNA lysidine(34) synthetase TilS [Thermoanaerobacteraceae bacterium]|nr:tRNA lysidine(34) synthetase TilS [Thermoanaerobacteraceae bacterium]
MDFEERVRAFISRFNMLNRKDTVLVGVSGGPDSMALLHFLWQLRREFSLNLAVAHLNHLFRGEEARADARMVEEYARGLGLPVYVEEFDVPAYRRRTGLSAQDAARRVRYRFFERLAGETGAGRVALGHHADDQAETILFNFLRGAGPSGLKGIPPVRGRYIRPFLDVRRREIESYCRRYQLPVREDASNKKPIYTRNRIRLELIPLLEQKYNPGLVDALVHLGHICREEDAYLEEETARLYSRVLLEEREDRLVLSIPALLSAPVALRRRLVRRAFACLAGEGGSLSFLRVEALLLLVENPVGGRVVELPGGVKARRQKSRLYLWLDQNDLAVPFYSYPLVVPGVTFIPETGQRILARVIPSPAAPDPRRLSPAEALLDYDSLPGDLRVRRRREGDRFHPLGMAGSMKLKKFLIDRGVARERRDEIPLVVAGEQVVWVGGLRPGEPWKVTPHTKRCLYLQMLEGRDDESSTEQR